MTRYWIHLDSTSELYKSYWIEVNTDGERVTCDCKSGRIRGYCKHIKFYKSLIKSLLHENPGVEREKGGE